jgi:hypothetical protein
MVTFLFLIENRYGFKSSYMLFNFYSLLSYIAALIYALTTNLTNSYDKYAKPAIFL